MAAENIRGRTPVVIAQGASMFASDTLPLANEFNLHKSEFLAVKSPISHNIGTSYEQGEKLAATMISLKDLTGEAGIGIGHSKGGIDWIYAVTSLRRQNRLDALKAVYFVSTPLQQHHAFHAAAMPFVIGSDLFELFFDQGHLLANDFRSSSQTRRYLSGPLPESDTVEYVMFYNPEDKVIRRDSMIGHAGVREDIRFDGHPSHIHQLHDAELTQKLITRAQATRRGLAH